MKAPSFKLGSRHAILLLATMCLAGCATPAEAAAYKICPSGQQVRKSVQCPTAPPSFSAQDATVAENAGSVTVTVTKAGTATKSSLVGYATSGGTAVSGVNYSPVSGTATVAASQTSFNVIVPIRDDGVVNPTLTLGIKLTATSNATIARNGVVSITNTDLVPDPTVPPVVPPSTIDPSPVPPPTSTPPPASAADVLSEGDSISMFWGGNHTGIYSALRPTTTFVGHAVGGSGLGNAAEISTGNDLYPRQPADLAVGAKVLTVLIGANNLNAVGSNWYEYTTPQAYANGLFAWIAPFRAAGTKVAVGTVLPQCTTGSPTTGADLATNTNRALLNPIIRAAVGTKIDAVIDFAADPTMGPDAAACDTTLYQPGGLHPTDGGGPGIGGQGKLEAIYAPVVDALLASAATVVNNNPTVGQAAGIGAPDIATSDHNVLNDLQPAWGSGAIPSTNAPDVVGAFRFICRHTNLGFDDPTVYPGQPGKSHLHDQTGVYGWNAFSNYGNLRTGTGGGGSGCNDVAGADSNASEVSWAGNRTPYWQPALLDGLGNVIVADFTAFYYKRRPTSDPVVKDPANAQYQGKAVPLPNGIKFLFGAFPSNSALAAVPAITYVCTNGAAGAEYSSDGTFAGVIACAKAHTGGSLEVRMTAPDCWDGINLDSVDHRSHVSFGSYAPGYYKCDAQHPYVIPAFTYAVVYTILSSDTGDIHFSSDEMDNAKPRGWSFHVDYGPAAWDPQVKSMWENGCLNGLLNCSGGDLGNGKQLKGAAEPIYLINGVYTQAWRNPVRLVPVPVNTTP